MILTFTKEAAYDATASTLDLPSTVTFDYNNETVTENVTWDTSTFAVNQIGEQVIYGTFTDDELYDQYNIKRDGICFIVNVLPYTFSLIGTTNEYSLKKYYGTAEEELIPETFNKLPVTQILDYAFYSKQSLRNITIPNSVKSIRKDAFAYCSSLTNVYYEGTIESWCNISFSGTWSNPMYFADHFYMKNEECNWYEVTEISIPNTICKIGEYQFIHFENITSITIPESVTSIGNDAFSSCSSLTNVYYEGTIESWCNILFISITNSTGSNPMHYAEHFYMKNEECNWYEVTEISIPNTICKIGDCQFYGFENITSITIPESVTIIGNDAFYFCKSLTSITLPESVTSIGNGAFTSCESLTSITIPESITSIGIYTFRWV